MGEEMPATSGPCRIDTSFSTRRTAMPGLRRHCGFGYGRTGLSQHWPSGARGTAPAALVLIEQQGLSQAEAAQVVGVHRQTVNIWLRHYREQGEDGVLDGRRVSPPRGKGMLTAEEAGQIRGWIADKTPEQLKLPFALWTSRAVRDLIGLRFGK